MPKAIITGTGSYIPSLRIQNNYFINNEFYGPDGIKLEKSNEDIINKLKEITCINERKYISDDLTTSDMAFYAASKALEETYKETLDYIIVAQNLGDLRADNIRSDMVPTIFKG